MIALKIRVPNEMELVPSSINASIGEIQAVLNKTGIVRGAVSNPKADYFRFNESTGKLYLQTIEGETKEVGLS